MRLDLHGTANNLRWESLDSVANVSESEDNLASRSPASLRWLAGCGAKRQRFVDRKDGANSGAGFDAAGSHQAAAAPFFIEMGNALADDRPHFHMRPQSVVLIP
jgi:hypothetical protein